MMQRFTLLGLVCSSVVSAEVKLPAIFSDHMVLQAEQPLPVWGWASAGEKVTVTLGKDSAQAIAAADGTWRVTLPSREASGTSLVLSVKGDNELSVEDVLIGEVWLCSGQSNMAMTVSGSQNFEEEKTAAGFPAIRMFTVSSSQSRQPHADCKGSWVVCSPESVGRFSATAYFFGRDLHRARQQPVGLINSSVGGTPIEAWTSMDAQSGKPELAEMLATWEKDVALHGTPEAIAKREEATAKWREAVKQAKAEGKTIPKQPEGPGREANHKNRPAGLFNGKIHPLIPYAVRGALWYQGEANGGALDKAQLYETQLPLMIADWRARWTQKDFPFAWVQLPNYREAPSVPCPENDTWPVIRESMTRALQTPRTGMTVNLDIGMANNIHPVNKQEIGRRLSLWARANVYGEKVAWSGPIFDSVAFDGSKATLSFRHAENLSTTDGAAPKAFVVAGEDRAWVVAEAKILDGKVVVSHPGGQPLKSVRYAWANNAAVNLTNETGLPAAPFRTDDWPLGK